MSPMRSRKLRPDDLQTGFRFRPDFLGDGVLTERQSNGLWSKLLVAPGFSGVALSPDNGTQTETICGFGASVFVEESFVQAELANPSPGLNSRVISTILSGANIVLTGRKSAPPMPMAD